MDQKTRKQWLVLGTSLLIVLLLCLLLGRFSSRAKKDDSHSFAVYFTEILSSNKLYSDAYGHFHDYVELYNSADGDIDISGFKLTDSQRNVGYVIPEGTVLGAGQYLVIWCEVDTDEDIANFSISKSGGEVLYLMNRKNVIVDTVTTIPTKSNMPMILTETGTWTLSSYATPGYPNTLEGYAAYKNSHSASNFQVRINEILTANTRFSAPDGGVYDFVELMSLSSETIDLSGCRLTDDPQKIKYSFPEGTLLAPGSCLLLWCGGDNGLPFNLSSAGGETLLLMSPGGDIIDELMVPAITANYSYARQEDGSWIVCDTVTPGFTNDQEGLDAYLEQMGVVTTSVFITEVMADNASTPVSAVGYPDWIELTNTSAQSQDISGWWVSDDPEEPCKWQIPSLTIPGNEAVLIFCDGLDTTINGELHTDFSLSRYGETILLSTPGGLVMDEFSFENASADASFILDPSGDILETDLITPGLANTEENYLVYQSTLLMPQDLCLSEVMTANDHFLQQLDNKYYDWVEVYNNTSDSIDLSDYYLTDNVSDLNRFALPSVTIPAHGYYVVLLTDGTLGLNAQEDWLYLVAKDNSIVDQMHLKKIPYRHSYGRIENEGGFFFFNSPTPGDRNESGFHTMSSAPSASSEPGIYNGVASLSVSLSGPGTIYYTLDGSWPDKNDLVYSEPLKLTETTVIRCVCMEEGKLKSETVTLPFIINEEHTLPVVSLTLENNDLYGYGGIISYAHYDEEKYANIAYYDLEGNSFNLNCGVTSFGQTSRETNPKKSFKLLFRACYGEDTLSFDLFDDTDVSEFHSLVLRNGQDYPIAFIREELMTSLAHDASEDLMTTSYRYVILYLNGQYYGIFAFKEAFSSEYYASHMGFPEETCVCARVTDVGAKAPELYELMVWAQNHDLTDPDNYAYMTSHVDIDSLADWIIFESYCANTDILNNIRYLHSSEDDLWRYSFYDLDWSLLDRSVWNPLQEAEQFSMIPRAMLRNPEFLDFFLKRMATLLETTLSDENVLNRIDELCRILEPEMERERYEWGGTVGSWMARVGEIQDYVNVGRAREMAEGYSNYFGLTKDQREYYFGDVIHE